MLNKRQAKEVEALLGIMEDTRERIGDLLSTFQERLEAMSERAQESEKGERLSALISALEEAYAGTEAAVDALNQTEV